MNDEIDCKKVCSWLKELDLEGRSYSGRGMFGKSCLGVTIDRDSMYDRDVPYFIYKLIQAAAQEAMDSSPIEEEADNIMSRLEELDMMFRHAKQDTMGLGIIVYFENIKWDDTCDEEGDD